MVQVFCTQLRIKLFILCGTLFLPSSCTSPIDDLIPNLPEKESMKPNSLDLNDDITNHEQMNNIGNNDEHISSTDSKETERLKKKYYKGNIKVVNEDKLLKEEMTSSKSSSIKASLVFVKKGDLEELVLERDLLNGHVILEDVKLRNKRQIVRGRPKHRRKKIKKFRPSPLIYG